MLKSFLKENMEKGDIRVMTYEESYMKCETLQELEKEINSDLFIAIICGSEDRIKKIKEIGEKVANLKFKDKEK